MELGPSYTWTEIGAIPTEWTLTTVGQEFDVQLGKMLDADRNVGVRKPYLGNRSVQWDQIDVTDLATVPMTPNDLNRFRLEDGDILVCEGGEVGRAAIWKSQLPECYYQKALHRLRPKRSYNRHFLVAVLRRWADTGFFRNYVTQTSIAHLPRDKFLTVPLPLPSSEEQQAIANALSDVDALLDGLDRLITKKRDLKRAAMQQLLTGRTRLPGFTGTWSRERLDALALIDPEALPSSTSSDFAFNYISLECVDGGRLLGASSEVFRTAPSRARRILRHDDVLLSTVRPNLRAHLHFKSQIPNAICSTGFAVLRAKPDRATPGFLYAHLFAQDVNTQIERILAGSNYPAISSRDVRMLEVPCPPTRDEQESIANAIGDMDAEIDALELHRAKTHDLKIAMMQELLTGKTRLAGREVPAAQEASTGDKKPSHNWAFNEAVVISTLVNRFGKEDYPLGRKRYTKLSYLLHRRVERRAEGYLKKAAGPYNPQTKYGGPEKIAKSNGYILQHKGPKGHSGFIAANNIAQAEGYFEKWYGSDILQWLEQFRFKKNDELEVLATVDMATVELHEAGTEVNVASVKSVIANHPEWEAKLDRAAFSDANIAAAIEVCGELFSEAVH